MLYEEILSLEGDMKLQFLHLFFKKRNKNDTPDVVVIQWAYVYKTTDMWSLPQGRPSMIGGCLL